MVIILERSSLKEDRLGVLVNNEVCRQDEPRQSVDGANKRILVIFPSLFTMLLL